MAAAAPAELPVVRIAMVLDGPSSVNNLADQVETEILTLTAGEFDVRIDDDDVLSGDWTRESVDLHIEVLLKDPDVDLIIALRAVASHVFCCREVLPKPVIAALVIDPEIQNLPLEDGASGIENLNYLALPRSLANDIDRFREIVPFERLTMVFNRWFTDAVPEIRDRFAEVFAEKGLDFDFVFVGTSVDEALEQIPSDTEAAYLAPLLHLSDGERERFVAALNERRPPTFSLFGIDEVWRFGVFAAQRTDSFWQRLARRVTLNVQRILLGEDAGTIPVAFPDRYRLTINMETARKIGVFPPWDLLTEADLLNHQPEFVRTYSLEGATQEGVAANLDIAAKMREVAASDQEVPLARALLRPRLEADASGVWIDDDRTSLLSGQSEGTGSAGLTLTQLASTPSRPAPTSRSSAGCS